MLLFVEYNEKSPTGLSLKTWGLNEKKYDKISKLKQKFFNRQSFSHFELSLSFLRLYTIWFNVIKIWKVFIKSLKQQRVAFLAIKCPCGGRKTVLFKDTEPQIKSFSKRLVLKWFRATENLSHLGDSISR